MRPTQLEVDEQLVDLGRSLANELLGKRAVEHHAEFQALDEPEPESRPELDEPEPGSSPEHHVGTHGAHVPEEHPALERGEPHERPRSEGHVPNDEPFAALQAEVEATLRERLLDGSAAPHPYLGLPWSESTPDDEVASDEPRAARTIDVTELRTDERDDAESGASLARQVRDWAVVVVVAAVAALMVQTWVVQLYEIPSESMYPTLKARDRVVVNKLAYRLGSVERGDLVVFRRPESERNNAGQPEQMIKRVVGIAGDVVEARGGVVYIDGAPLDETGRGGYLDSSIITANLPQPVTVEPGHVFVMGDNRESSRDSRFFGSIPEEDLIGRAVAIGWPPSRWGGFAGD